MNFKDLQMAADQLPGEHVARDIWALASDPRFPAVVALLDDVRKTRLAQGCGAAESNNHGVLAHAMGSVDAVDEIKARIQTLIEPPAEEK